MSNLHLNLLSLITSVRNTGTKGIKEEEELRRIRLVNSLSMAIVSLILVIGLLFFLLTGKLSILLPAIAELLLALSPLFLNRNGKYVAACLVTYLTQCVASLYFGMVLGNVIELQTVVFFLLLLTFLLFDNSILRKVCFTVALVILVTLEANYFLVFVKPLPLSQPYSVIFKTLSFFGLFCLIIIVGSPYVKSHDSSYKLKKSLKNEENQNYAKSVFIRNVSHEIQGTFLGIIKMAQSLRAGLERKEDIVSLSDDLIDGCHTYKRMLTNLLEYTKIDAGVMDSVYASAIDLRTFLQKIINVNKYSAIEKGVEIHLSVADEIPLVLRSDEIRLTQIFNNLLTNAIKFTRPASNIYVIVEKGEDSWQLYVRDEGPGIPEEKLKSIFDLFVTDRDLEGNREGVGLGLFITRHLVEDLLKGTISVKSQENRGACFQVSLPLETI
ncbi:HAMP domain-containing sensor histidine kinase [Flavitalea sp. BT771]|uniref:sensor histidine kinase n=1 Tax=Flavitalea sp. BT771 TaxID=3063329 RepID=UPI0026E421A1|nr:HAMP domain-containing sensor histidine kinase [Flavitalea sp. BT771]MDO6429007.1 HAMP domain-containing sensor histidine kinase [Flavitalea sp. BT771]MDV6218865.1 HAMP domain-containing sensor histidine kinase [Flavitalea sp. BT771]